MSGPQTRTGNHRVGPNHLGLRVWFRPVPQTRTAPTNRVGPTHLGLRGCAVFTAGGGGAGGGGAGEELMCMRGVEGVVGQLESDMDHIAAFMVRHNLCSRCGPSSTMLALISSDCG